MAANKVLQVSNPTLIDSAVTAPVIGNVFSFAEHHGSGDFSAIFQAVGTVTTITAQLEISLDGGTTWAIAVTGANFFPTNAVTNKAVTPVICGALYRVNYTAASGSINLWACSN